MRIHELSDGRFVGYDCIEIASIPATDEYGNNESENVSRVSKAFFGIVQEFHRIGCDWNTALELLWVTERAKNQVFNSRVRLFVVIRRIDPSRDSLCAVIGSIKVSIATAVAAQRYEADQKNAVENIERLAAAVDDSCLFSVSKNEKVAGNTNSPYLYYYCEIVPEENLDNFEAIVTSLSQYENCCMSFQLFPAAFTRDEIMIINEACSEMGNLAYGMQLGRQFYRDTSAVEPYRSLEYYLSHANSQMFLYNILVFGPRPTCASLSARVISLLQYGGKKIVNADFKCMDLSQEGVRLSDQFASYPWNINTKQLYYFRNSSLTNSHRMAKALFRLPYMMTAEEVVAFFRLPLWEQSTSAIRGNSRVQRHEQLDEEVVNSENIVLGTAMSEQGRDIPIACPDDSFTKHALIAGTPGSGKTTFSINLLLQFARRGIPFLAIEPTKTEYRAMIDALPEMRIFTPGNNAVAPFIINPFIPPRGVRIEQYIPSLASAFNAAFSMPAPLDVLFLKAVRTCYSENGWRDYSTADDDAVRHFGLYEFILTFKSLVNSSSYSKEVKGNLQSGGVFRLMNLIEQNSNIYDTVNTVPIEDLVDAPTVIELNAIDNSEQKSLLMALLLINICVYTKHNRKGDGRLKNIMLIDEAHAVLGGKRHSQDGMAATVESTSKALQDMVAEIRSFGTGIIIADQAPSKVGREIVANTDIKVAFRLVESNEKGIIADSTNMDDKAERQLSLLKTGEAYVYYGRLETPQLVRTEDMRGHGGVRLVVGNDEITERMTYWDSRMERLRPFAECGMFGTCESGCDFIVRADAEHYAGRLYDRCRGKLIDIKSAAAYVKGTEKLLPQINPEIEIDNKRLVNCTKLRFLRRIQLETGIRFGVDAKRAVLHRYL
ncbi:MAG: hypothetical protein LBG82_00760 [Clostridiales Family XIII bacterium]|nr:hypothetical protein [Clostridiales Family XIII bacterium]